MDFNPRWHEHLFGDCPLNSFGTGKGLCPSLSQKSKAKEEVKEEGEGTSQKSKAGLCSSLTQKSSWFSYHGTSMTCAVVAVCQNSLNKSEMVFGDPARNDHKHPRAGQAAAMEYGKGTYETTAGRGVYSTTDWRQALNYAPPYVVLPENVARDDHVIRKGKNLPEITSQVVLLVRTPGSLEKVGIFLKVHQARKPSWHHQQDLEGNAFDLGTNWAAVDMDTWIDSVIEEKGGTIEEVRQKGFIRWMLEKGATFDTETYDCLNYRMKFDPEIHKRQSCGEMQKEAQTTHTGEARWTNMDGQCYEVISSGCAIVGFFVGYGVALCKEKNGLCASRKGQAESTINWELMPPLCRLDDVDAKNEKVVAKRHQKTEAAGSSSAGQADAGDTHNDNEPLNPENVDDYPE